jgi:C4-dicarboxylate transporter DctQ subunit
MAQFTKGIWHVPNFIMGILMICCVLLDCANIIARYIFLSPIIWAEEVLGFMLVWGVFVGAVLVTRDDGHLKMDLLSSLLGPRARLVLDRFDAILTFGVCGLVAYKSAEAIKIINSTHETSVAAGIPMAWIYAALPLGFALVAITAMLRWAPYPHRAAAEENT